MRGIFFLLIDTLLFRLLDSFPLSSLTALTTLIGYLITSFILTRTHSLEKGIVEGCSPSLSTFIVGSGALPLGVGSKDNVLLFGLLDSFPLSSLTTLATLIGCLVTSFISSNTHSLGMGIVESFSPSLSTFVVASGALPLGVGSEDDVLLFGLVDSFPLSSLTALTIW